MRPLAASAHWVEVVAVEVALEVVVEVEVVEVGVSGLVVGRWR